jgi:hypothetical protein
MKEIEQSSYVHVTHIDMDIVQQLGYCTARVLELNPQLSQEQMPYKWLT